MTSSSSATIPRITGTPRILCLYGRRTGEDRGWASRLASECEALGLPFLCPDLRSGPGPSAGATRAELVLGLLGGRAATYAVVSRSGAGVLADALAMWRLRQPGAPLPVAAVALCLPAGAVRPPVVWPPVGLPTGVVPSPGGWGRVGAFFSEVSGVEFRRRWGPRLAFGVTALSELRGLTGRAAEAADVLMSAYGAASHSHDTHVRRLTTTSGLLVWARDGARLVGCSQVRGDGKWGACGILPAYRGFGVGLRLGRLARRQIPGQLVEVGRAASHALQLVLGCGFRPVRDEGALRSAVRASVGREIVLVGVDELGIVYRRRREGGGDTGPLRLYVAGRSRRWAELAGDHVDECADAQYADATAATSGKALPRR